MSGPQPGFLATYNSLTDKHLAGYFSNRRIRRHLQRSGLISRSGRIIPEKEYRLNAMRKDHQKYVQECLAQAIFHKVLDMERHHQLEIKRRLENFVKKERVQKIKVEQSRRSVEDANLVLSPHPPLGPRSHYLPLVAAERASPSQLTAQGPLVDLNTGHPYHQNQHKEFVCLGMAAASRPNTAPGNLQGPLQRQPLRSGAAVAAVQKTSDFKQRSPTLENDQRLASGGEKSKLRLMNSIEYVTGMSPYRLPIINNYVIPVPPPPLQTGGRSVKTVRNGMPRRRRFRPTTAPNDLEQLLTKNAGKFHKPSLRSNALVTMIFLGKGVHLSHDDTDFRDEIKVYQQHCGGENLCVYKGKLLEGETFQFISKRHHGFPFSLTFFLNGMQVDRLSSCCEYKHQKHSRLGGRHGYFGFLNVERASPCYRCIIAMGLDKKPSPPKRKMEEESRVKQAGSLRAGVHSEPNKGCAEQKRGQDPALAILPGHGASVEPLEDKVETGEEYQRAEMKELSDHESEDSQEDTGKNDYDEDFEADEEVNEEGQTSDQMSGMSRSSSDDEKDNLDHEKESRNSSQKTLQASDSGKDENDGYSESDSEDNEQGEICKGKPPVCEKAAAAIKIQSFYRKYKMQQKFKPDKRSVHCASSMSTLYSSEDDSAEKFKDNVKDNKECDIERAAGNKAHTGHGNENGENDQARMEDNPETFALENEGIDEAEETEAARVDTEFFHENIMAIQYQGPEVSGHLEHTVSVEGNTREDGEKAAHNRKEDGEEDVAVSLEGHMMEVEDRNEESPQSDEGDCKSVQKKIAEAIADDHHMNSELEPSDSRADEKENLTSTEHVINEAPDGASLAEETRTLEIQKAAEQVVQEGQMLGEKQALEKEDFVAEEGGAHSEEVGQETTLEGDLLSQEDTVAVVLVESQLAVEKSVPEERAMTEEDSKEEETGGGGEMTFGKQEILKDEQDEEALKGQMPEGEEVLGAVVSIGKEVDGAETEEGQVVEEAVQEASEAEEGVSESGLQAEGAAEEGGFAGKDVVEVAVDERQEAVEDAKFAQEFVEVIGPEAEEAVEEAVSEGEEDVEKLEPLLETSGEMDVCTEAAAPGREELKKSSEFPQLLPAGKEWIETGKAAIGAAMSKMDEPLEVEERSLLRAEDAAEEATCSSMQAAPGLEVLVGDGRAPVSEGSSQLEEMAAMEEEEEEEEGLAGAEGAALLRGSPALACNAQADAAVEEKPDEGARGGPAVQGASGSGEEGADGGAGPRALAAGVEELLEAAVGTMTEHTPLGLESPAGPKAPGTAAVHAPLGEAAAGTVPGEGDGVPGGRAHAAEAAVPGGGGWSGAMAQAAAVGGTGRLEGTEVAAKAMGGIRRPEGAEAAARAGAGRPKEALPEAPGEDQDSAVEQEQPQAASARREREAAGSGSAAGRRGAARCREEPAGASSVLEEAEAAGTSGGRRRAGAREHPGMGLFGQEGTGAVASGRRAEAQGGRSVGDEPSAGTGATIPRHWNGAAGPRRGAWPAEPALSRGAEEEASEMVRMERDPGGNEGPVEAERGEGALGTEWKLPGTSENAQEGEGVTENAQDISGAGEQLGRQQGKQSPVLGHTRAPGPPGAGRSSQDP